MHFTPDAVSVALRDLDIRLRALDELRKAIEAGDPERARRAYDALPTWAWPATAEPAVRSLRVAHRAAGGAA